MPRRTPPRRPKSAPRKARARAARPPSRLSGAKQQQVVELWHRGGMSTRAIAVEAGVSRQAAERVVAEAARALYAVPPEGQTFTDRFNQARARRLEGISESLRRHEAELAELEKKRRLYSGETDYTKEYGSLTSLILQVHSRMDDLRAEAANIEAEPPPDEVLEREMQAARPTIRVEASA